MDVATKALFQFFGALERAGVNRIQFKVDRREPDGGFVLDCSGLASDLVRHGWRGDQHQAPDIC